MTGSASVMPPLLWESWLQANQLATFEDVPRARTHPQSRDPSRSSIPPSSVPPTRRAQFLLRHLILLAQLSFAEDSYHPPGAKYGNSAEISWKPNTGCRPDRADEPQRRDGRSCPI